MSERVHDVNDFVVSRYPQRGEIRKCVLSQCLPAEENYQNTGELQDGYQNELARDACHGTNIGYSPSSDNSSAKQQNCFFEYQK